MQLARHAEHRREGGGPRDDRALALQPRAEVDHEGDALLGTWLGLGLGLGLRLGLGLGLGLAHGDQLVSSVAASKSCRLCQTVRSGPSATTCARPSMLSPAAGAEATTPPSGSAADQAVPPAPGTWLGLGTGVRVRIRVRVRVRVRY